MFQWVRLLRRSTRRERRSENVKHINLANAPVLERLECRQLLSHDLLIHDLSLIEYSYDVVAQVSDSTIATAFGRGPSINNNGDVAFIPRGFASNGNSLVPVESVYIFDGESYSSPMPYQSVVRFGDLDVSGQELRGYDVQINDNGFVVWREEVTDGLGYTRIIGGDHTQSGYVFAKRNVDWTTVPVISPFAELSHGFSINNNDRPIIAAVRKDATNTTSLISPDRKSVV